MTTNAWLKSGLALGKQIYTQYTYSICLSFLPLHYWWSSMWQSKEVCFSLNCISISLSSSRQIVWGQTLKAQERGSYLSHTLQLLCICSLPDSAEVQPAMCLRMGGCMWHHWNKCVCPAVTMKADGHAFRADVIILETVASASQTQ